MGRRGRSSRGPGAAGETVFAVLLDHDRDARPARDHWHQRRHDRGRSGMAWSLFAGLLFAGRRHGALLALCRYGVDLPAADALSARDTHPARFSFVARAAMTE